MYWDRQDPLTASSEHAVCACKRHYPSGQLSWTQVSARSPLSWLLFGQGWWLTAISCNLTRSVNVFLWSDTTKTFCTLWYFVIIFVQLFHAEPAVYVQHAHGYFQFFFFNFRMSLYMYVCFPSSVHDNWKLDLTCQWHLVQAESTLNQLLTCMDGLVTRESGRPVVVIAATNRPEDGDMTCCSCAFSM
jgi:SpoVK/Ycf46/Vps4 family AAA+-type ATPase